MDEVDWLMSLSPVTDGSAWTRDELSAGSFVDGQSRPVDRRGGRGRVAGVKRSGVHHTE